MYVLIWVAFIEILVILFPVTGTAVANTIHLVIGVAVLALAYLIHRRVASTSCPGRIKLITKTTFGLAVFQAVLGISLFAAIGMGAPEGGLVVTVIDFLHVANALAIITQASSSATAFDMWEEGEFTPPPPPTSSGS